MKLRKHTKSSHLSIILIGILISAKHRNKKLPENSKILLKHMPACLINRKERNMILEGLILMEKVALIWDKVFQVDSEICLEALLKCLQIWEVWEEWEV